MEKKNAIFSGMHFNIMKVLGYPDNIEYIQNYSKKKKRMLTLQTRVLFMPCDQHKGGLVIYSKKFLGPCNVAVI